MKLMTNGIYYNLETDSIWLCLGVSSYSRDFKRFLLSENPIHITCDFNKVFINDLFYIGKL